MRSTFFHLLSLLMILAFSASCGKDESKKSSAQPPINPVYQPLPGEVTRAFATGEVAKNNLNAWYHSHAEGTIPDLTNGLFARIIYRYEGTVNTDNSCDGNPIKIFGVEILCVRTYTSSNMKGTPITLTMLQGGDKKVGNDRLLAAIDPMYNPGHGLTLTRIDQSPSYQSQGSVFVLNYINANRQVVVQVIDTGLNSRANPVYTYDGVNGKEYRHLYFQF